MEKTLQLDIVTPDREVFSGPVQYVSARGVEGEFGVLPGHEQLLAALTAGCLRYDTTEGERKCAFVSGGFAEVAGDKVTILAESSELAENIDEARAVEARKRAQARLEAKAENLDAERAQAALQRALLRLQACGGLKSAGH